MKTNVNYSQRFERDVSWYLKVRHIFNFDGQSSYHNKKCENIIQYDKTGVNGIKAFYHWDSNGLILKTKHPNILRALMKTKGSVNLHIKMYAEDRAKGILPMYEFKKFCEQHNVPIWFIDAVERQKSNYY